MIYYDTNTDTFINTNDATLSSVYNLAQQLQTIVGELDFDISVGLPFIGMQSLDAPIQVEINKLISKFYDQFSNIEVVYDNEDNVSETLNVTIIFTTYEDDVITFSTKLGR